MRHFIVAIAALAIFGCADSATTPDLKDNGRSRGAITPTELTERIAKLRPHEGKRLRVRTYVRQDDGSVLLMSSVPTKLTIDQTRGRLKLQRAAPRIVCTPAHLSGGLQHLPACNTRVLDFGEPMDEPVFLNGVSEFYTSAAMVSSPTPTGMSSDSIGIFNAELPYPLTDYYGNALLSYDLHPSGLVSSGAVEAGDFSASYYINGDLNTPEVEVQIVGPDNFSSYIVVTEDTATVVTAARDQQLLLSGTFAKSDCPTKWGAAAFRMAGFTAYSAGVVYGGAAVVTVTPAFVTTSGLIGPLRRSISKQAVALVAGVAHAWADSWVAMKNAIQDALDC